VAGSLITPSHHPRDTASSRQSGSVLVNAKHYRLVAFGYPSIRDLCRGNNSIHAALLRLTASGTRLTYPFAYRHLAIYLWSLSNKTTILAASLSVSCAPFRVLGPNVTPFVLCEDILVRNTTGPSLSRRVFGNQIRNHDHRRNHDRIFLQLLIGRGISGAKDLPKIDGGVNWH
jgi:hypothetical protein